MHLYFLMCTLLVVSGKESLECPRYSPDDVYASAFSPIFRRRIEFLQETLEESFKGLEQLKEKAATLPDHLKDQMGALFPPADGADSTREELTSLLGELLDHTVKGQQRAWNRVADTTKDILDPERAPRAPKTLTDLMTEIEGLESALGESEASFSGLLTNLGGALAQLLRPMMKVMDGMVQMGGEFGLDELKGKVDNMMGRVLLRIVIENRDGKTTPPPQLFEDLKAFVRTTQSHFEMLGRKMPLEDFWKSEWQIIVGKYTQDEVVGDIEDPLYGEDISFITGLIQDSMMK